MVALEENVYQLRQGHQDFVTLVVTQKRSGKPPRIELQYSIKVASSVKEAVRQRH